VFLVLTIFWSTINYNIHLSSLRLS
jgi:hypothetical protein